MNRSIGFVAFVFCFAFLSGCAQAVRKDSLELSVNQYLKAIRFQDESAMIAFVEPKQRVEYSKRMNQVKDVDFSLLEVLSMSPDEKLNRAVTTLEIEYVLKSNSALNRQRRVLEWVYYEPAKIWLVTEVHPLGRVLN